MDNGLCWNFTILCYTYSFFVFVANLTWLYLLHIPIFGLSLFGFFITCLRIMNQKMVFSIENRTLKAIVIIYPLCISSMLLFIWFSDIFAHLTNPRHLSDTPNGKPPLIIYSLDLAIIIPLMISAAILLYKKTSLGYILSGIILTKTTTLGFALMAMSISLYVQDLNPNYYLIVLWCVIGIIGAILSISFLKNLSQIKKE